MKQFFLYEKYTNSLKFKLIFNIILIHVVLIGFIMADLLIRERSFLSERINEKALNANALLASNALTPLLNNDLVALDEIVHHVSFEDAYLIFIMDRYGKVRASNEKKYFNLYLEDPLSRNMLHELRESAQPTIQKEHDDLVDTLSTIKIGADTAGYVRIILDKNAVDQQIRKTIISGVIYMVIAIFLGALFAWTSVRRFTAKLDKVSHAAKKIAAKDFDVTLPEADSNDELSNMIRALETMVLSMDQYIEQLNKTNELIHDEKEFAEVTLSSIADGVIVTDTKGVVNFLNPAAEKIVKYTISEAKNKKIEELFTLVHEDTQEEMRPPIYESIAKNKEVWHNNKAILLDKEATRYAIEDSSAPIRDIEGNIRGAVFVFRDITQKKKDERKVRWQATHDELTKLNNRIGFHLMLDELCLEINETTQHVLFFMDLDKFKIINDTAGHLAGDEVLRQVAKLLQKKTRKNDFLCRFGGDEFGLILKNCDVSSATKIANKLIEDILDYSFVWGERQFKIGLSIGIAQIDHDNNNPTTILSNADFACYKAKDLGRNRYYVFKEDDNKNTEHIHEINWVSRINRGIKTRSFVLYVQKIQGLSSENIHYEVLIRLVENGEIFYPDSFLPHAQIYSLMPQIDRYVVSELFSWYAANRAKIAKNQKFAINLAGQSISDNEFAEDIIALSEKYAIEPENIIFEVTESTAIENLHLSIRFFTLLKEKGFAFSLDDFGTGLSSFAYLKSLPVDYLKIDGVFIKDILTNEIDKGMVESIHKISSLMQIKTVAEYVENHQITDTLKTIGIDYAQGYAIAKPQPIQEII